MSRSPFARVGEVLAVIRLTPFDVATEEGRARERYRRAVLTTGANIAARVVSLAALFAAVRLAATSLTPEALGLWLLLVTATALLSFADLGVANGMLNVVAEAVGRDDDDLARQAIASALITLTLLALLLGGGFALAYPHVAWDRLLSVEGTTSSQAGPAVAAFVVATLLALPLGVAQRVHLAYQEGWLASLWVGVGGLLSLIAVALGTRAEVGVAGLVGLMAGGLPAAYLANSVVLFGITHRRLRPRLRHVSRHVMGLVLGRGGLFFVIAVAGAVGYQTDMVVISHYLGVDQVSQYAVTFRIFVVAPLLAGLILMPLWPAYADAVSRGDLPWARRTLWRSMLGALVLTGVPTLVLLALARPAIDLWVGARYQPTTGLLIGMAAWAVVNGASLALGAFFNGTGVLRFQAAAASVMAVANITLSIVLVQRWGVAGPIWATVVTQLAFVLGPSALIMRGLVRSSDADGDFTEWVRRWGRGPDPASSEALTRASAPRTSRSGPASGG